MTPKDKAEIDHELLHRAIQKWGSNAQIEMITEECLELCVALQKLKRRNTADTQLAVIDEIADVRIMIEQAQILFGDPDDMIGARIKYKMDRLKSRLDE